MRIIDISRGMFRASVYPGDPAPERKLLSSIEAGACCNLTAISISAHTATHIDALSHFIRGGKTISDISLAATVGPAAVVEHEGVIDKASAERLLSRALACGEEAAKRLLIKGEIEITTEAAEVFAERLLLVGVESQSVGPIGAPMAVHLALLAKEVVLLEGLTLAEAREGAYLLSAAPIHIEGADGAPCRALLIEPSSKNNN